MAAETTDITGCEHADIVGYLDGIQNQLDYCVLLLNSQGKDVAALAAYLPVLKILTNGGQGITAASMRAARRAVNAIP